MQQGDPGHMAKERQQIVNPYKTIAEQFNLLRALSKNQHFRFEENVI